MSEPEKRRPSRPVEKPMPESIPDTPENIMHAVLNTPPKSDDEWNYLKNDKPQAS